MSADYILFRSVSVAALALVLACAAPAGARAQSVALIVNGEPITNLDIAQRTKLITLITRKAPSRQEAIQELIDDKVKIKEAKKYSINLSASDVDSAYANMAARMRLSADQLSKMLEAQGVRPEAMKQRLKAETAWSALVRGRFQQSLLVGEKDVHSIIGSEGDAKEGESFEYQLRPVVLFVPNGSSVEQRRKEAETLRARVQSCEDAVGIFRSLRNGAIRDQITKTSADLPGNLREVMDKTPVGHMTAPEVTRQGIEMVVLCSRKPTTADTPAKRAARDKLYAQKYEAKSKSYLQEIRKGAMIEYR
jgi:peptidyl-prolyl cis-trans isomerase SurA